MAILPADRPFRQTTLVVRGLPAGVFHPRALLPIGRAWVDRASPVCSDPAGGFSPATLPCSGGVVRERPVECAQDRVLYFSAEVLLECSFCHDGAAVLVPAGQFRSYASQADADQQAVLYGEALLRCTPADPASLLPDWEDLTGGSGIPQVDVYGLKGFDATAIADTETGGRLWCTFEPALDFCDGPECEGIPPITRYERYSVRWKAMNDGGVFSYARVGEQWSAAPVELFPAAVEGAVGVSLSFDANARPCFAFEVDGTVELRRFVADAPTTYTWAGTSPKLFFDGLLQPDDTLRDLVCFYLSGGRACVRMQRDNFATEYVLADVGGLATLAKVERGIRADQSRHLLSAVTVSGERVLLRSSPYPLWPLVVIEEPAASVTLGADGACTEIILVRSETDTLGTASVTLGADGACTEIILVRSETDTLGTASVTLGPDGACTDIIVPGGTYLEPVGAAVSLLSDGACWE